MVLAFRGSAAEHAQAPLFILLSSVVFIFR